MQALGRHLLLELFDCDPEAINSLDIVKASMVEAAKRAQATIVDVVFHEFNPFGISGVVVIAESHLAIHTWPEYRLRRRGRVLLRGDAPAAGGGRLPRRAARGRPGVRRRAPAGRLPPRSRSSYTSRWQFGDDRPRPLQVVLRDHDAGRGPHARHRPDDRLAVRPSSSSWRSSRPTPTASAWCWTAASSRARPTSSSTTSSWSSRGSWPTRAPGAPW